MGSATHVIDEGELMERIGGDTALLGRVLKLYRETAPTMFQELRNALAAGDAKAVWRNGHSLKGVMGNLSAGRATAIAHQIELAGSAQSLGAAESLVHALEDELRQVRSAMTDLWRRVAPGKPCPLD